MDQCLECPVGYVAETPGSTSCTECVPDGSTSSKVETHDTNAVRAWGSPMLQPIVGEVKDRSMMTSMERQRWDRNVTNPIRCSRWSHFTY